MILLKIFGILFATLLILGLLFIVFYAVMAIIKADNVESWFDPDMIGPIIITYLIGAIIMLLILMVLWAIVSIAGLGVII